MNDSERRSTLPIQEDMTLRDATHTMVTARRRLIRGAFAVPAVMTVHSGSALANGSSLRCLVNPLYQSLPPVLLPGQTETVAYRRVQLGALLQNGNNNVLGYYLDGNNVLAAEPNAAFIALNRWILYDVSANAASGAVLTAQPTGTGNPSYTPTSGAWAVFVYDAQGNVVGVGNVSGTNYAATGSCWGSFRTIVQQ